MRFFSFTRQLVRQVRKRKHTYYLCGGRCNKSDSSALGIRFEHETVETLNQCGFHLHQKGGAHDGGIDFEGLWLVAEELRIPIIGQCKRLSKPVGVEVLRDFNGATDMFLQTTKSTQHLRQQSAEEDIEDSVVGCIVSASSFSTNARRFSACSNYPQILISLSPRMQNVSKPLANSEILDIAYDDEGVTSTSWFVSSVFPNRSFMRYFPNIGFCRVDGNHWNAGPDGLRPGFWYKDNRVVVM